ncbi:KxYKxGKxW signal peptide domain-containing protein [Levilactobacillus huananensis]|uniref:KxYKxGKxW signal peptide domain-containing protein n=1 Tax=Levilactobacillus huananensis TaxID=2486019 RepID=UPI000F7B10B9|nr:KxYKxGKxW signal peptide domain-containing protein [Levilactobacillus huananensis]
MYFNRNRITKEHLKMYKVGKSWVVGSIALVGLMAGLSMGPPLTASAATNGDPREELPGDAAIAATQERTVKAEEVVTDEPVTQTTTPVDATLDATYDDAQTQVDTTNDQAATVNDSLAKLQALLNQSDLTAQTDWQTTLQAALDDYQKNASEFTDSASKTQALIAAYQDKINATIKEQPNAVKEVTDTETTGTKLADYQKLTADFQQSVTTQVQVVQTNLANYAVSEQVNQVSAELTTAADALNVGLDSPTLSSAALATLKVTYDQAVAAYNAVVVAYNDKTGGKLAVINSDQLPDMTQLLADRQVQEAYDAAVEKYQLVQNESNAYNGAIKVWQDAVAAYNQALAGLTMPARVEGNGLLAAQEAVAAAVNRIAELQVAYSAVMSDPNNQAIVSAYQDAETNYPTEFGTYTTAQMNVDLELTRLTNAQQGLADAQSAGRPTTYFEGQVATYTASLAKAQETLSAAEQVVTAITAPLKQAYDKLVQNKRAVTQPFTQALIDLQDKLTAWQSAYRDYGAAVAAATATDQTFPDFEQLTTDVQDAQANVKATLAVLTTSQAAYQATLRTYQTALAASGRETKATDGELPDLATLQTDLNTEFTENSTIMDATPALLAVIKAEFQLQQRIVQVNQIVMTINADQAMLNALYTTSYQGDMWTTLAHSFQAIGDDLVAKAADYQLAIAGDDTNTTMSYSDLVTNLEKAQTDYGIGEVTYTYPEVVDMMIQQTSFSSNFTTFETSYREFLTYLETQAPDEEINATAVESMENGANLSTNGVPTSLENGGVEGGTTINIYQFFGKDLAYFVGRGAGVTGADLSGDKVGTSETVTIDDQAKIAATSESGTPYYRVSPAKVTELTDLLTGMITPNFEKDGVTYHLTGVEVPGTGTGLNAEGLKVKTLGDIYTFTTLDPVSELMAMFSGVSRNSTFNHVFAFFYTASPQPGVTDHTALSSESTLPTLKTFTAETLASSGAWETGELTADAEVPTSPAPHEVTDGIGTVTGHYPGGKTVETGFATLTAKQAPTITLTHIQETPTGNPGTTDPKRPGEGDQTPGIDPGDKPTNPGDLPTDTATPVEPKTSGKTPDQSRQQTKNSAIVNRDAKGTADRQARQAGAHDQVTAGLTDLTTTRDNGQSATTLPQTDEQAHGIFALIGSLLLALSGLSLIKLRQKE